MNFMDFAPVRTPQEKEELYYRLQKLRAIKPLAITGDIANNISVIFNKTRKSTDVHIYLLMDKIQEFSEYWSQVISEYEANMKHAAAMAKLKREGEDGTWKDHDEIELETALERIQFLELQLSNGADVLIKAQVKCADYDSITEKNAALEKENEALRKIIRDAGLTLDPSLIKKDNRSLRGKLQGKLHELFTISQSLRGSSSNEVSNEKKGAVAPRSLTSFLPTATPSFTTASNNSGSNSSNDLPPPPPSNPSTVLNPRSEDDLDRDSADMDDDEQGSSAYGSQGMYSSEDQLLLSEIEEFQKQIQALVHEKNEVLRVNMHLEEDYLALQSQFVHLEKTHQQSQQDILKQQETIDRLTASRDQIEQAKTKLEQDYKGQMKINKVLIATVHKLEQEVTELQEKYSVMSQENTTLHTEIITHKNHLLQYMEQLQQRKEELAACEEEIQDRERHSQDQQEKMNYLQTELIKEKERNALLQSDIEIVTNEKERIAHALELTQKKLIQREETLEELLTINGLSTTPIMNTNSGNNSGGPGAAAASNLARIAAAFTNRDRGDGSASPVPGGNNLNNKLMQFTQAARHLSMSLSSKKFKDVMTGSGSMAEDSNMSTMEESGSGRRDEERDDLVLPSREVAAPVPARHTNPHHTNNSTSHDYVNTTGPNTTSNTIDNNIHLTSDLMHSDYLQQPKPSRPLTPMDVGHSLGHQIIEIVHQDDDEEEEAAAAVLHEEGKRRIIDEAERRLLEQFQTAALYPNDSR